jgi:3-hydroxybutyryl-CoA dehydrogenase
MRHEIQRVLVVGAGTMGTQIGAVFALGGFDVTISDVAVEALDKSEAEANSRISRMAENRITRSNADLAVERMSWTTDAAAAVASADLVVEAATERLDIKRQIFAQLNETAPPHTLFTTNSSTLPSSLVAEASGRAEQLCNLHFFNPALVMACVEVIPNPQTSDQTIDAVLDVVTRIGKTPVRLRAETPGFIANRLMLAIQDEAVSLYESGVADIKDIDTAARLALGHPMGPFELMDLVGLDVIEHIHRAKYDMTDDPSDLPAESLIDRVRDGQLGRKTGHGWYDYA